MPLSSKSSRSPGAMSTVVMTLPVITTMPAVIGRPALGRQVGEPGQRAQRIVGLAGAVRLAVALQCAGDAVEIEPGGSGSIAGPMTMPPFQALSAISDSALLVL